MDTPTTRALLVGFQFCSPVPGVNPLSFRANVLLSVSEAGEGFVAGNHFKHPREVYEA